MLAQSPKALEIILSEAQLHEFNRLCASGSSAWKFWQAVLCQHQQSIPADRILRTQRQAIGHFKISFDRRRLSKDEIKAGRELARKYNY